VKHRVKGHWLGSIVPLALGAAAGLAESGCIHSCVDVYYFSGATLTLHLPPASDVTAPEAVNVCRDTTCATATLPGLSPGVDSADFSSSRSDVDGRLSVDAAGVRLMQIFWTVNEPPASKESYDVTVTDAAGTVTGQLTGDVTYKTSMPDGEGCGTNWNASLSD
jgi:hypothetical protein